MSIYKNTPSQKVATFAYDQTTGAAKTGDAANITGYVSLDWGAANVIDDTNPAELDATNMPGWYVFDLTQAETNAEVIVVAAKSATANVVIDQIQVFTENLAAIHTGAVGSVTGAVGSVTGGVTLAAATHTGAVIPTVTAVTNDVGITQAGADKVWVSATRTLSAFGFSVTVGTNSDKTGYALSPAGVQAIWNALTSALTTAGSIGKLLVDRIDAAITSRMATFSYTAPLDAAGTRAAIGLAAANLDAQLADLPTNSELSAAIAAGDDPVLAAIALLNNLSSAGAQAAALAALAAYDAATGADVSGISVPTATQIADAVLSRGVVNVEGVAEAGSLVELILAAFESGISGTTWTINKSAGGTFSVRTVTTDAGALPITSVT